MNNIEKRYKEFVLHFRELNRIGAPYGTNDLIRKAQELRLPIPDIEDVENLSKELINERIIDEW